MTFPAGTSVTRLAVYPDRCADGLAGGTPHLHTASTEAYVVTGGHGALQTLDPTGFHETPLRAGSTVWFTPGTIHRAVNHGDLAVVVVMQNAGLPEAGDAVMTFPTEVVTDPERYRVAATLPPDGCDADLAAATAARRDLAVTGFLHLVDRTQHGDTAALAAFYDAAVALVRPAVARWRRIWAQSAARQAQITGEVLDAMARGDGRHLLDARSLHAPPPAQPSWGMCGRLLPLGHGQPPPP